MPSNHIQNNCTVTSVTNDQSTVAIANKPLPPPSKLPPPPPKNIRPLPPPPPPPPPPRNSSQINLATNQLCSNNTGANSSSGAPIHSNVSSANSINLSGRCSHFGGQSSGAGGALHQLAPTHNQRGFSRHGDCGSRSSVSSHGSSMSHHHHSAGMHNNNNLALNNVNGQSGNNFIGPIQCNHQPGSGCVSWSTSGNPQHSHANSSSLTDNGSCNNYHGQEARASACLGQVTNHCSHHMHGLVTNKCQTTSNNPNPRPNTAALPQSTTIGRSTLYPNEYDMAHTNQSSNNCCANELPKVYNPSGPVQHHHHHHHHDHDHPHVEQIPSSLSPFPNINSATMTPAHHRFNQTLQTNCNNGASHFLNDSAKPVVAPCPCSHVHRINSCSHHHQPSCFEHHLPINNMAQQQQPSVAYHNCGGCVHNETLHHDCNASPLMLINNSTNGNCPHHHHHHHTQPSSMIQSNCSEMSNSETLSSTTAHVHNLSNSSTTTHTSNVAVKHQLQFHHHRPVLSRGARSSSSQHYEQYGLSSAASTSSATASLSSYQAPMVYDDAMLPHQSNRMHQPLPPAPPPPPQHSMSPRSQSPSSSSHQIMTKHNDVAFMVPEPSTMGNQYSQQNQQQQFTQSPPPPPPLPPLPSQQHFNHASLPPLPPKPVSPNASSCSTQITTVRTSPSLQNQPITRITSYAGVQSPLPTSDTPPPLPPSYPNSRTQPLVSALMARITNSNNDMNNVDNQPMNPAPNVVLNYNRGGIITDAERKTDALTRQVEFEMEQKHKSGEPLGLCSKCGAKVMPSQEACKAMNQIFHANCFVCCECGRTLLGKTFYPVGDRVYCEEDFQYTGHMKSLEKCAACSQPIFNMILPAMGKSYHPKCFKCCKCGQCLDGVPFTIDRKNKIYCVKDYHNIYSPKCAACGKSISPIDGTGETVRVVSMDKDYHIDCYCCEDCGLQLTDEEPSRSYPLDGHLLCQKCHINRLSAMNAALSLN